MNDFTNKCVVEEFNKYLRLAELDDMICLLRSRDWFLGYEDRHTIGLDASDWPCFRGAISIIDKEVVRLIRIYEKQYGCKIPLYLLRRYVKGE